MAGMNVQAHCGESEFRLCDFSSGTFSSSSCREMMALNSIPEFKANCLPEGGSLHYLPGFTSAHRRPHRKKPAAFHSFWQHT